MSERDVEIIQRIYECWARQDLGGSLKLMDPEIEWQGPREFPDLASTRHGRDEVREYVSQVLEAFEEWEAIPEEFIDLGEGVAVLAREEGRGGRSGVEVVSNASLHAWTVRDGRAASFKVYWNRAEGLEAVGLKRAS